MSGQTVVTPNDGVIVICLMGTAWVEVTVPGAPLMTYGDGDSDGVTLVMVLAGATVTAFGCVTAGERRTYLNGELTEQDPDRITGTVAIYSAGNLHLLGSDGERWPA